MILKCIHCNGIMKVDDGLIPKAGPVKVRCPHCRAMEPVSGMEEIAPKLQQTPATPAPEQAPVAPASGPARQAPARTAQQPEPQLPKDAFRSFRFPAEKERKKEPRPPISRRKRLLVWGGISLAVVIAFALLVNIILPGPIGKRPRSGDFPDEPTSAAPADRGTAPAGQKGAPPSGR